MDDMHQAFFEEVAQLMEYWTDAVRDAATGGDHESIARPSEVWAFEELHQALTTAELEEALRVVLFSALSGFAHSVMVSFDGGTQLADQYTITLVTSSGPSLGPGLHEMLYEHLYATGRLTD